MNKPHSKNISVVFLGAGRPEKGEDHPVLRETFAGSRVLDWLLQAYPEEFSSRQFVGGYRLNEVVKQYHRGLDFIANTKWETTGAVGSLFLSELPTAGSLVVSYSDILYRAETVQELLQEKADITVAVDSRWKDRYRGRSPEGFKSCEKVNFSGSAVTRLGADLDPELADGEFIGLVCFNETALAGLRRLKSNASRKLEQENISALVEWLRIKGLTVQALDVQGDWAELDDPRDLARFVLGTKAETLARLRKLVRNCRIEEQITFSVERWRKDSAALLAEIQRIFANGHVAVRSSAVKEDGFASARAGVYTSLLDVPVSDSRLLREAIEKVLASYDDKNDNNQVLVQPMVREVKAAGVVFTRTLERGAPYYVINYDDSSGSTASVTGGAGGEQKTLLVRRDFNDNSTVIPQYLQGLLPALREIEALVGYDALDIEFAVNDNGLVHVFQVRPIAVNHDKWKVKDDLIYTFIAKAEGQFTALQSSSPFLLGREALFGIMPDWNPAEIIGTNPGLMAASLYRFLIMDDIWARQRAEYGYRDVRPMPLMVSFANRPYVDIRASFNSFTPAVIADSLAEKLIDFYLTWLKEHPHLHDKVEFEVVPTCYSLDFERWEKRLQEEGGFSEEDIGSLRQALFLITANGIRGNANELKKVDFLEERFKKIVAYETGALEKAYLLLHDCKSYGTLPFAHLARNAFVAVTLLKSAVSRGVISQGAMDDFLNSLQTVGHEFTRDTGKAARGELPFTSLVERYGYLRPGTYDITVTSYREEPEKYLRPLLDQQGESVAGPEECGSLWAGERRSFFEALQRAGFDFSGEELEGFMRGAIEGREYSKLVFTRNLSAALDCLVAFGEENSVDRADLAHICIEDLLALRTSGEMKARDIRSWLLERAEEGRYVQRLGAAIELPPLLVKGQDFHIFCYPPNQPNFIGNCAITAPCIDLADQKGELPPLGGAIIMIPQADPGYDWLFSQDIAGLITMYGGANSHMAIRAAEFALPAAIGIGEVQYQKLAGASMVELNAEKKWLKVIK